MVGIRVLDCAISKSDRWSHTGRLSIAPASKPTDIRVPLSRFSQHPPSCHTSWPMAEVGRLQALSGCSETFVAARDLFVKRLLVHATCTARLLQRVACTQFRYKLAIAPLASPVIPSTVASDAFWLVLPYHSVWFEGYIRKSVKQFFHSELSHELLSLAFESDKHATVRFAWRLTSRPLGLVLTAGGHVT